MSISLPQKLATLFPYITRRKDEHIAMLKEAVAIKSVSALTENWPEVEKMMKWYGDKLEGLGAEVEYAANPVTHEEGKLPSIILAQLGKDPKKKTILVYGHLDVQPAAQSDGWDTDPFVLTEKDEKLFGRGSTDDKGPALGWLIAVEAYQKNKFDIPVNIKFCLEGMEESGSEGLDELIALRKEDFFQGVDYAVISDNYWLGTEKPCLTYGLRGCCYFFIELECSTKDLHSGVFGGTLHEGMADLIALMNSLVDNKGKILVPGIMDNVSLLDEKERSLYENVDFSVEDYKTNAGVNRVTTGEDKVETLLNRWRYPSLSLHGIEGAFDGKGAKTVIPRKVTGKFSVRIVPNQTPEEVEALVVKYLEEVYAKRGSPNKMKAYMFHGGRPWITDPFGPNFEAGKRATKLVYGVEPDFNREGGSIPVTLTFQEATKAPVMLLPIGRADDGAHSQNEKIDKSNYIQGCKLLAAYLHEIAKE
ncbi:Cytosolic non-specific dipeptidase [Halotydeus destructor]|nr:Cytosolic non-specific dipeptidase [Halotydeus destructor]